MSGCMSFGTPPATPCASPRFAKLRPRKQGVHSTTLHCCGAILLCDLNRMAAHALASHINDVGPLLTSIAGLYSKVGVCKRPKRGVEP